jgi:ribulose kinase
MIASSSVLDQAEVTSESDGLRSNWVLLAAVEKEFRREILFPRHREEAAFGASMIAAVASGICADISEAGRFVRYF